MAIPYLVKRRAGWYIRIRTPADLRPGLGEHVVRTLQTTDLATARGHALRIAAGMPWVWHEVRLEAVKILGKDIEDLAAADVAGCDRGRLLADFDALAEDDRRRLKDRLNEILTKQADDLRHAHHDRAAAQAVADAMDHARMAGKLEGMREAIVAGAGVTAVHAPPEEQLAKGAKLPVSQHLETYFADHQLGRKTVTEYQNTYRRMIADLGDLPIGTITEEQLINFFARIPATVKARGGRKMAAAGTMQKHATALKSLFTWAAGKKLCRKGIASELRASKAAKKEEKKFKRRPFTKDELERIFSQPLFCGAKSNHFLNIPGNVLIRDHRFYFPLVALLTGGRRSELAQALISDMKMCDGTPYLYIVTEVDEDEADDYTPEELEELKSLKTENAKRCIPIHPVLHRLGFMEYLERRRKESKDGLLFPVFDYGKLYNDRIFVKAKAKTSTTAFHSLRHCYKDMVRGFTHNEELQNRLMGHAPKGAGGGYGSPLTKEEEVAFFGLKPSVSLAHLYSAPSRKA